MSDLNQDALDYHSKPRPGKISVELTKPTETARDLSLAYSPGVAAPVREIAKDPEAAYKYTNKGNLVAVISDGSAILGLGNLGGLASKPVMEGKGVLFKRFAGIDVFDIEVDAESPQAFIDTVKRISPTFGGINLEDIKAPECFEIERVLVEQCDIPLFHDDQHGTAIIAAAGLVNALELQNKNIEDISIVCIGAGAAGVATLRLLMEMGAKNENIYVLDRNGVIHSGRTDLNQYKAAFAHQTEKRTLADALDGADVFIGVSSSNLLSAEMLELMAPNPVVFALANPDPEILPGPGNSNQNGQCQSTDQRQARAAQGLRPSRNKGRRQQQAKWCHRRVQANQGCTDTLPLHQKGKQRIAEALSNRKKADENIDNGYRAVVSFSFGLH